MQVANEHPEWPSTRTAVEIISMFLCCVKANPRSAAGSKSFSHPSSFLSHTAIYMLSTHLLKCSSIFLVLTLFKTDNVNFNFNSVGVVEYKYRKQKLL
jgi:hypothetical protein